MIDVKLQPIGLTIMSMTLASLKYQAVQNQKNIKLFEKEVSEINRMEQDADELTEISFNITANMIDKRFTTSKNFIQTGVNKNLQFKKSLTKSEKQLQQITEKSLLKSRMKYNRAVSAHTRRLEDKKMKSSFKLINLKKLL